ncbi:MAG: hypothetical protein ACE5JX_17060 [Acidobacteriota bacterium]
MKRILLILAAVIMIAAGGVVWLLYSRLDSIVKSAIEHYGSEATGTTVQVDSVHISPSTGRGTLRGLRVGNPEGFSSKDALGFGEITVQIDISTLTSQPIVIDEVLVDEPRVNYELNSSRQSNIDVIRKNVEGHRGEGTGGGDSTPTRLLIKKFSFQNGEIEADMSAIGAKEVKADLPTVRLENVGAPDGATPAQIGKTVFGAMAKQISQAVTRKGLMGLIEEKLGQSGEAVKDLLKGILKK